MRTVLIPMPLLAVVLLAAALLISCTSNDHDLELKDTPPEVKLYSLKHALIEYEYSGGAEGNKTHVIANYGMYQRMEDKMLYTLDGKSRDVHQLEIIADTLQYSINLLENTGTRRPFDRSVLSQYVMEYSPEELQNFQESYIIRAGGRKTGTETILGKECTVFDLHVNGITVSLWNSLTMRSTIRMGDGEIVMTAVKLNEDVDPKPDMFVPPKNIKISEPQIISRFPDGHPPVEGEIPIEGDELPEDHPPLP